jgi:hypothetical protein
MNMNEKLGEEYLTKDMNKVYCIEIESRFLNIPAFQTKIYCFHNY